MPKQGHTGARLESGGVEVVFEWTEDRFTHTLTRGDEALQSVELDGLEGPVFQEVHQQGDVVFASGAAGDLQWSASVEPSESGFLLDVACRVKRGRCRLGWGYAGAGWRVTSAGGEGPCRVGTDGEESSWLITPDKPPRETPATIRCRYLVSPRA